MMTLAAKIISWLSLGVLIVPSFLFLAGKLTLDQVKSIMLMMTIVWFISASMWMWKNDNNA